MKQLSHIKRLLNKGFLILWATAIFWFYLGSLVNFHQNRIWGKILIPACFTHSSANIKDFGTIHSVDHETLADFSDFQFPATIDLQVAYTNPYLPVAAFTFSYEGRPIIPAPEISTNRLRGPPVA